MLATRKHNADPETEERREEGAIARQALKSMLAKGKKPLNDNTAETEKNRQIGALLAEGKIDEAAALRDKDIPF